MALTLAQIKAHMVPFEGEVPHMYLDSVGLVTIGIGNMLPNIAAAEALPFVRRSDSGRASSAEIRADWEKVTAQSGAVRVATFYAAHTQLELPAAAIDALYQRRVDEFKQQLRGVFAHFDTFPDDAQLAVLDMAFNLGVGALNTKWPKFKAAVNAEKWSEAVTECVRPSSRPARNAGTQALFHAAAQHAGRAVSELPAPARGG